MLLVNLCIADLLMIQTLPLFLINLYHRSPYAGVTGAKVGNKENIFENYFRSLFQIYGVISVCSAMAAIWFLAAVTMQRAWVVLCISRGKQNRITKTSTRTVTMGIWVAALATSAAPLLGWNNYVYEVGLVKTARIIQS